MAASQLLPRILEQSLFNGANCLLNGTSNLILFTYVNFNPGTVNNKMTVDKSAKPIEVRSIEGVLLGIIPSIGMTVFALGIGRRTLGEYINHNSRAV